MSLSFSFVDNRLLALSMSIRLQNLYIFNDDFQFLLLADKSPKIPEEVQREKGLADESGAWSNP